MSGGESKLLVRKFGFTLAEVLITLGIIGIVAAMTLPTIIQKHTNLVVENRLKKFYTITNQAVLMAEERYGDKKYWFEDISGGITDDDGNVISSNALEWYKKYFGPYIKSVKITVASNARPTIYLADGSAFTFAGHTTRDWIFFTTNPDKCLNQFKTLSKAGGKCAFFFNFNPNATSSVWRYHYNKGIEPFKYKWDGKLETLYNGSLYSCSGNAIGQSYCTAIIQMNGWKIPKDYPFKVLY